MSDPQRTPPCDEQVYQENRGELGARQVYTADGSDRPGDSETRHESLPTREDVDEISAESFPASDAPPNTPPASPRI